jgi:TonB-linked SusC/RagA family outer membrane protein
MSKITQKFFQQNFIRIKLMLLIILAFQVTLFGQEKQVKGTVTDASGASMPGVNVMLKGTQTGTVTDINGNYSIVASEKDILVFSFIGYLEEEYPVGTNTVIDVGLEEDVIGLDEVVVIGYGTQKKKLNTGATVNIGGDEVQALNTTSTMDALKGISPGVNITQNNGMPGSGTKVYIRGIGTIDNAKPLYIVDGISVGDIDNLSPSDIESIDILKDAASAAIYGSRAANGVILVTTKSGKKDSKAVVSYDTYIGWSNVYKKPDLLNAQQYAEILSEANANSGKKPITYATLVPEWDRIESGEWTGTNWFDEITVKNAGVQSHALNVTGGTAKSTYSLGASYLSEQGILGKQANSIYKRLNLRLNSEHVIIEKAGRDILVVGENMTFTNTKKPTLRTGNIYWSDVHNMLVASPFMPVYDSTGGYSYSIPWDVNTPNPIALLEYNGKNNKNNNNTITANAYFVLEPIKNLKIRSSFGINNWYGSSWQWIPRYSLSPVTSTPRDQVTQRMNSGYTWTQNNTITYSYSIGSHNFSAMVGNEIMKNAKNLWIEGKNDSSLFMDAEHAYLSNEPIINSTYTRLTGKDEFGWGLMSYFGRLSYDYKETYLLTLVMRADGSSNFDEGHRWGKFPSVAAGWVVTNESFMAGTSHWLNFMKIRGSWGRNGNQDIAKFQYLATLSLVQANYFFGTDKTQRTIGSYPPILPNPNVSWETSEQLDIGTDMNFLNSRLQFSFDWYKKDTRDWLVVAPALQTNGTGAPFINGGTITNKGVEIALHWNDRIGEFNYGISGSMSFNHNEVVDIKNDEKIIHGPANVLSQGTSEMFRAQVGYPVGYFWGYETDGILQDSAEVDAWVGPDGEKYFTKQAPGDVRFVDQNHNGNLNDSDKVMIGNPNPDFILGIQLNAEFKGFYIQVTANGAFGQQVAKSTRSFEDSPKQNYETDVYERWHGPGTSDKKPRLMWGSHQNTKYVSDIWIENADFLRISNVTIGYDLSKLFKKMFLSETRLYVSAKNLYTFTKYSGMDPEVGYGPEDNNNPSNDFPWSSGIDLGLYPSARTYMVGLSIKF